MYINVPIRETVIENNLSQNSKITKITKEKIIELFNLLKICLEQNCFTFNHEMYRQNNGLAMGSGIMADIFFNHIKTEFIMNKNNQFHKNIVYYHRYVDDILYLMKGSNRQVNLLN